MLYYLQVPETEDEGSSSDFNEFSKLLLKGQLVANETRKMYTFTWRGYKACVSSKLPKLSHTELKRRFNLAMKSIQDDKSFKKPSAISNEPTKIPETQFEMDGGYFSINKYVIRLLC